jgi:hypothetical protein
MNKQTQMPVEPNLNISKQPMDAWVHHELDQSSPWVAELLREMNEKATTKTPEQWLQETELKIKMSWIKHFKGEIGEYLLVKAHVKATYATECVSTLTPLKWPMDFSFMAAFVPEKLTQTEEYQDTSEIWLNGETWELYPYQRNQIPLSEMLHEQIYLNYEYYPRIDTAPTIEIPLAPDKPRQ